MERTLNVPTRDALTGLLDRRAFVAEADRHLRLAGRRDSSLALMYVDLDRFKQINDRFGHAVGDATLRAFAHIVLTNVREVDVVARIGGEEFVILLVDTTLEGARLVAERIRTRTRGIDVDGLPANYQVTVSAGVAASSADENLDAFMSRADAALYEAKAAGRDCIREAP